MCACKHYCGGEMLFFPNFLIGFLLPFLMLKLTSHIVTLAHLFFNHLEKFPLVVSYMLLSMYTNTIK